MDFYGISDVGLVRESNQDRFIITVNGNGDIFEMKVYSSFDPYEDFVLIDTYSFEYF